MEKKNDDEDEEEVEKNTPNEKYIKREESRKSMDWIKNQTIGNNMKKKSKVSLFIINILLDHPRQYFRIL